MEVNLLQLNRKSSNINFNTYSIISSLTSLVGVSIFIMCLSRVSRKLLLVGGLLILTSCEASVICFTMNSQINTSDYTLFISVLFFAVYSMTLQPISCLLLVEMLEPRLGALSNSLWYFVNIVVHAISYSTRN